MKRWLECGGDTYVTTDDNEVANCKRQLADAVASEGYEFARNLERSHDWSPDSELVEILDGYSTHEAEAECIQEWIDANGAQPKHAIGTKIILPAEWIKRRTSKNAVGQMIGELLPAHSAGKYLVHIEALGHIRPGSNAPGTIGLVVPWSEIDQLQTLAS